MATPGPAERATVRGSLMPGEALLSLDTSISTEQEAQCKMVFADDGDRLLASRLFSIKAPFDINDIHMAVAAEETSEDASGPLLAITARARAVQVLKGRRGALIRNNMSPTEWLASEVKAAKARFVGQPSAKLSVVGRNAEAGKRPESTWDSGKRYASDLGYLFFEAANTVYFGKPTWLVHQLPTLTIDCSAPELRPKWLTGRPTCRRTADDERSPVTVTFDCTDSMAETYRPGKVLVLRGIPGFNGVYLITASNFTRDGTGSVTAVTPIDPEVQAPATAAERAGETVTGGAPLGTSTSDATGGAPKRITMDAFLYGLRMHESGGNYRAKSPISSASGAYQYVSGTWNRYGGYSQAYLAPASVQDARARADSLASYNRYNGDWEKVAARHFYPVWADDKTKWSRSPGPGNPTVQAYVNSVMRKARDKAGVSDEGAAVTRGKTASAFVALCQKQAGDIYVFGAEASLSDPDPDAFDCSELIEWALARLGIAFVDGSVNQIARAKPISVPEAIRTRGALLFRPGSPNHIAVSLGNGKTIEARGRKYGVGNFDANTKRFTRGGLVPGLQYGV